MRLLLRADMSQETLAILRTVFTGISVSVQIALALRLFGVL